MKIYYKATRRTKKSGILNYKAKTMQKIKRITSMIIINNNNNAYIDAQ